MRLEDILQQWENYLINIIQPVIQKTGSKLEGNIHSEGGKYNSCDSLINKRENISRLVTNAPNGTEVLEIGFNAGYSSLLMLMSNSGIKLTCTDINSHPYTSKCYERIKQDYPNIDMIYGSSINVLPSLHKQNKFYDIIHIDGGHARHIVKADLSNSLKLSKSGTYLIVDDTNLEYINKECDILISNNRAIDTNVTNGTEYKHRILRVL